MEFDYIVIGAGSSGSAVAGELVKSGNGTVALIEAGGETRSPFVEIPALSFLYAVGNPKYDWCLNHEPDPTCNDRVFALNRGRGLGGSSAINGMVYLHGEPADFDIWSQTCGASWSWSSVREYYKKMTGDVSVVTSKNHSGPLKTEIRKYRHRLTEAFLESCSNLGLERVDGVNAEHANVSGLSEATQKNGRRFTSARAFIEPVRKSSSLKIFKHSVAEKLLFDERRANGVTIWRGNVKQTLKARRAVILSAGAVMTPAILMRSGIGPTSELRENGIDIRLDAEEVGRNLQDHAELSVRVEARERTLNQNLSPIGKLGYGLRWMLTREGPVASPGADAMAKLRLLGEQPTTKSDTLVYFSPYLISLSAGELEVEKAPGITFDIAGIRPRSRGKLLLASKDHRIAPKTYLRLLDHESDFEATKSALGWILKLTKTNPLKSRLGPVMGVSEDMNDAQIENYIRSHVHPSLHTSGTCRMGADNAAVVDPRLRVRNAEALYVADASVVPQLGNFNLNAVCMMLGMRAAKFILEDTRT